MSVAVIEVVPNPAEACSAMLVGAAAGSGHIVLAGGSTPRAAYEHFADAARELELDLSGATFWFGDERAVPPDDDRSNYRMVRESLLDRLDGAGRRSVRRIKGELGADAAAEKYDFELRDGAPSEFDLVILGLGPDGHTASLFPGQETLSEQSRLAVPVHQAGLEPFVPRVTMTLPALAVSRQIVFLVSGASKADAVAAAFGPNARPDPHVPASMLPPLASEVMVLLDDAAAGKLQ